MLTHKVCEHERHVILQTPRNATNDVIVYVSFIDSLIKSFKDMQRKKE